MGMEFCIWGCGKRGKNIYRFMQGKDVCAFIDSNPEFQDSAYQNVPIISFETYLKQYRECIVIVTPYVGAEEIEQCLCQYGVTYLTLNTLPQEISHDGISDLLEIAAGRISEEETAYLYGLNLFSIRLLDFYADRSKYTVKIVPEDGASSQLIERLRTCYGDCIESLYETGQNRLYLTSDKYDCRKISVKNPIVLYDFLDQVPEYHNPRIEELKNIHRGKRCFIIGTGPSLRIEDLDTLAENNEICIGVNGIIRAFQSTAWRPDYYVCQYAYGFNEWKQSLLRDCKIDHMLISDSCLEDTFDPAFIKFHLSMLDVRKDSRPPFFSQDFSCGAYVGGNVMYTCIQLAAYLGCSEMYLYGVDHSYAFGNQNNHFSEDYLSNESGDAYMTAAVVAEEDCDTEAALAYAGEVGQKQGFKIFNASRQTKLKTFARVDFDTLFR